MARFVRVAINERFEKVKITELKDNSDFWLWIEWYEMEHQVEYVEMIYSFATDIIVNIHCVVFRKKIDA